MRSATVLIAEEEQYLRDLYAEVLRGEGYEVTTVSDGLEALQKMVQGHWDIVLLDAMLPNINGFDVVKKLREHPDYKKRDKRIIFIFMASLEEDIEKAHELGDGVFFKSQTTPDDLVRKMKGWLAVPVAA